LRQGFRCVVTQEVVLSPAVRADGELSWPKKSI
jgi:hypothetical protein